MDSKPRSTFKDFKRIFQKKKGVTPAASPSRSPAPGPSQRLPPEPLDTHTASSQPSGSLPTDLKTVPLPSVPKRNETKDTLLGGFKTLLELGARVSQGLPTQIPKAVLESISYIINIAEVGTHNPSGDASFDLCVRKTTADNARMLDEMTRNLQTLTGQLQGFLDSDGVSTDLASHVQALIA